ncbi:MAG: endolytic transglycosylase MltG [Actinomycetota bacterium]|nr:endolytic transglycosylase MltG [Actinomycetota bacterium]
MSDVGLGMEQRGERPDSRRGSPRRGRFAGCLAVLIALAVVVGAGVFVVVQGRAWLQDRFSPAPDYEGDGRGSVLVQVQEGDTSTQIASRLRARGVIASEEAFVDVARDDERASTIQVGFYDMARRMSAQSAFERLIDTDFLVQSVVAIPEGWTVEQILHRLADDTRLSRREVRRAAAAPERLDLPKYAGGDLEGYLFPATYQFPPRLTARQALSAMVQRFTETAERLKLDSRAQEVGLSPAKVVTVASIVQSEVRRAEDMPRVARVLYNRLDAGMRLQMDSTVHYAVGRSGGVTTSDDERAVRSPYNTYRHEGLPPGPISAPGEAALAAALEPAKGDWLYFVTVNLRTGETAFAASAEEHDANVAQFRQWCLAHPGRC